MKLIVAVDREWGIGYRGELLARVRADLLHFQRLTTGKIVVLGSNTLSTFPGGRVLKNRTNLVLNPDVKYQPEGAVVVHNLDELFETLRAYPSDDVFVIGGALVVFALSKFSKYGLVDLSFLSSVSDKQAFLLFAPFPLVGLAALWISFHISSAIETRKDL